MASKSKATHDFRRKIKGVSDLVPLLGPLPRKKTVVMCHGTFDIVHPGHLRHLMYAKERGDVLIVSLTGDAHISKANYRPYVPQQLRAENLAAFEFVDYVVIDDNDTPLKNLQQLKPDLFAKGFDYFQAGVPPKTQEEIKVLESYGGEILFTPGDVMYSSSAIIENSPPKLGPVKLKLLMDSENLTFDDLRKALDGFQNARVHVIGDTIVDSYTYCRMVGGMTKTPTISVQYEKQVDFTGGAAIVARHIRATGAEVVFSTVLGNDPLKDFITEDLQEAGITVDAVIDKTRPTTQKNTFISNNYHLLRLGKLDNRLISEKICEHLCNSIESSEMDAYLFSDYRHGIFNRKTIPLLSGKVPAGALKVADSQVASRWGNILEFEGFDLITPNEREARFALGDQDSVIRPLAFELYKRSKCKYLMLTLGERGLITYRDQSSDMRAFFNLDSFADHVVDAVGSGDALLSYATLSLLTTKNPVIASILGSFAASIACEREGNTPITTADVLAKIKMVEEGLSYSKTSIDKILTL